MIIGCESHFDAAHRLSNYDGKCRNLHGHRYRVEVEFSGGLDASSGMVMDFADLKKCVNRVADGFDHAVILNDQDEPLISDLEDNMCEVVTVEGEPTAENLALCFYVILESELRDARPSEGWKFRVRLYETPTNFAEYP